MHDWNLRVILSRIWGAQQLDLKSWAVQRAPTDAGAREVEEALWRDRGDVDLLYVALKEYVDPARARALRGAARRHDATTSAGSRRARRSAAIAVRRARSLRRGGRRVLLRPRGREADRQREPARLAADAALRRERRRQDARSCAPASSTTCDCSRDARGVGRTPARAPFAVCAFAAWRDDPLAGADGDDQGRRSSEALGDGDVARPGARAPPSRRPSARGPSTCARCSSSSTSSRTTSCTTRTRTGEGTFAGEFPGDRQRPQPPGALPALDPRGRAGEARPLQGPHPAPVRELRAGRAPEPSGRARGDRGAGARVEPSPAAGRSRRTRSSRRWSTPSSTRRPTGSSHSSTAAAAPGQRSPTASASRRRSSSSSWSGSGVRPSTRVRAT